MLVHRSPPPNAIAPCALALGVEGFRPTCPYGPAPTLPGHLISISSRVLERGLKGTWPGGWRVRKVLGNALVACRLPAGCSLRPKGTRASGSPFWKAGLTCVPPREAGSLRRKSTGQGQGAGLGARPPWAGGGEGGTALTRRVTRYHASVWWAVWPRRLRGGSLAASPVEKQVG